MARRGSSQYPGVALLSSLLFSSTVERGSCAQSARTIAVYGCVDFTSRTRPVRSVPGRKLQLYDALLRCGPPPLSSKRGEGGKIFLKITNQTCTRRKHGRSHLVNKSSDDDCSTHSLVVVLQSVQPPWAISCPGSSSSTPVRCPLGSARPDLQCNWKMKDASSSRKPCRNRRLGGSLTSCWP